MLLSKASIESELLSKARTTARLFLMSLFGFVTSLGEPCGVAMGVAAVCVMIGGLSGPPKPGAEPTDG